MRALSLLAVALFCACTIDAEGAIDEARVENLELVYAPCSHDAGPDSD